MSTPHSASRLRLAAALAFFALLVACPGDALAQSATADFLKPAPQVACPPALRAALDAIRASDVGAHVQFLASRALEGRGLGTQGVEVAAEYVTAAFRLADLRPASGSSYTQAVPLLQVSHPSGELIIRQQNHQTTLRSGSGCIVPLLKPQRIAAPVVFAGYGITETEMGRDDYRGLDVRGKAVLLLGTVPPDWKRPELVERYAAADPEDRYKTRLDELGKAGATMLIAMEDDLPKAIAEEKPGGAYFVSPERDEEDRVPALVRIPTSEGRALLTAAGLDPTRAEPAALAGVTADLDLRGEVASLPGRNVIGILPGSDPHLRDRAVVIGAHMDHLGRSGADIFPGADDNASGVSALLAIARVLGAGPHPRRTVVFAAWTGEEAAHFGSRHYVRHPLWPLDRTDAYLNLDMIGHPWTPAEITKLVNEAGLPDPKAFLAGLYPNSFIEPGVADWATAELVPVLARAGSVTDLTLHIDRTSGRYGGSDYRSFARLHIPFIRFFGSYFPDYHKPGDTPERLDPAQVQRVARLACATLWMLADR